MPAQGNGTACDGVRAVLHARVARAEGGEGCMRARGGEDCKGRAVGGIAAGVITDVKPARIGIRVILGKS